MLRFKIEDLVVGRDFFFCCCD